jgi:hypothetical protein
VSALVEPLPPHDARSSDTTMSGEATRDDVTRGEVLRGMVLLEERELILLLYG